MVAHQADGVADEPPSPNALRYEPEPSLAVGVVLEKRHARDRMVCHVVETGDLNAAGTSHRDLTVLAGAGWVKDAPRIFREVVTLL